MNDSVVAVITAAGLSQRMGGQKKEYMTLPGSTLTVLGAVVKAFSGCSRISSIVITVPVDAYLGEIEARKAIPESFLKANSLPRIFFVPGGTNRRMSVYHALAFLNTGKPDYVLIHDGARPWVTVTLIDRVIDAVFLYEAVVPVVPLIETPKELDTNGFIKRHLKRASVGAAQTPQGFSFLKILSAHKKAAAAELQNNIEWTDDAEIWGAFAGNVATIEGDTANKKITFPGDL